MNKYSSYDKVETGALERMCAQVGPHRVLLSFITITQ